MGDLFYICKEQYRYAVQAYLTHAREEGDPAINLLSYEKLATAKRIRTENLQPATYIFTDMDRATPRELAAATILANEIRAKGAGHRVINDPTGVAERFEFLRLMHLHGINSFNAWLLVEHQLPSRFPVYVRSSRSASGGLSDLIENAAQLEDEIYRLTQTGVRREHVMIVEFQPTDRFEEAYVKYTAFNAAGEIFPGHVQFCSDWRCKMQSAARVITSRTIELERQWLAGLRWRDEIARAFEIAGIEYGRADFSLVDGKPQFFEINTNPGLLALPRPELDATFRDKVMLPLYLPILRRVMGRLGKAAAEQD